METPDFFQNSDHFVVEDLLDLPNDESMDAAMTDSSTGMAADNSCNSSFTTFYDNGGAGSFVDGQFSNEFCVPDELAELEWLSNFGEESFSSEDLQKLHLIQGLKPRTTNAESSHTHQYHFQPEPAKPGPTFQPNLSVPAKARSKRSRIASGNWTSRLLSVSDSDDHKKKMDGPENSDGATEGRKCLHCATDKTPQWRTGPMGPKTLCNACGVRYKSGRLVPEYRPAASPTFVLTKHSNSHRKVVELRRQKEMMRAQQQQQEFMQHHHQNHVMFGGDDQYLIHQRIGPDYRQMI